MSLAISYATENLLDTAASVTVATGTPLDGYGSEKLNNGNPGWPFKVAETAIDVVVDLGAPGLPELCGLIHTNLDVAAHMQGSASTDFSSPLADVAFTVPIIATDGYYSGVRADLRGQTPCQFWRLHITGNSVPIIIGEFWMGSDWHEAEDYFIDEYEPGSEGRTIVNETDRGVEMSYPQKPRFEKIDGTVRANSSSFTVLQNAVRAAKFQAKPFLMVPRDDEDDVWMVKYMGDDLSKKPIEGAVTDVKFPVKQVSNGETW